MNDGKSMKETSEGRNQNDLYVQFSISKVLLIAAIAIAVSLLLRLMTIGHLPFLDAAESRYTLAGTSIAESGDWFTPTVYYEGELKPYLSKPPLHFWLEAVSIKLFGENEFALRLPSFLAAILMMGLTAAVAYSFLTKEQAAISVLSLLSSALFFFLSGWILVDMTLSAAITGVMASFFLAIRNGHQSWKYLFFIFLAMGVLVKGPIAVVLPGAAIFVWCLFTQGWNSLRVFPWLRGILVFLLLTVPVFVMTEYEHPGSVRYFFLNQNLFRYLVKDYGDDFGSGHRQIFGASWFFLFFGFFPWSLLFVALLVRKSRQEIFQNKALLYFLCWALIPACFLTFARQLLGTYLLPSFGGLALSIGAAYPGQFDSAFEAKVRRVAVYVLRFLALVGICLAIWSLSRDLSIGHNLISIGAVVLLCVGALQIGKSREMFPLLVKASVLLTLTYASINFNLCDYTAKFYSSKALLEELDKKYSTTHPTLVFPLGAPLSAYIYGHHTIVDGSRGFTLPVSNDNSLIVVRDKQSQELHERFGSDFKELLEIGKWRVYHLERHVDTCAASMDKAHQLELLQNGQPAEVRNPA